MKLTPFEWRGALDDEFTSMCADTSWCSYRISRSEGIGLFWEYCVAEYYDEGSWPCETEEDGKRLAWNHYVKRMSLNFDNPRAFRKANGLTD